MNPHSNDEKPNVRKHECICTHAFKSLNDNYDMLPSTSIEIKTIPTQVSGDKRVRNLPHHVNVAFGFAPHSVAE